MDSRLTFTSRVEADDRANCFHTENTYGSAINDGTYEIALTRIKFPRRWKTFSDSKCYVREMFNIVQKDDLEIDIPGIFVDDFNSLATYINDIIQERFFQYESEDSQSPKIKYIDWIKKFRLITGHGMKSNLYTLEFEGDLKTLFGFPDFGKRVDLRDFNFHFPIDKKVNYSGKSVKWTDIPSEHRNRKYVTEIENLIWLCKLDQIGRAESENRYCENMRVLFGFSVGEYDMRVERQFEFTSTNSGDDLTLHKFFYICCTLVEPEEDYNDLRQHLRTIDLKESTENQREYTADDDSDGDDSKVAVYSPVWKRIPKNIEIQIRDFEGKPFPFEDGYTSVTLHIRKCNV
jgi:hypothetical protein